MHRNKLLLLALPGVLAVLLVGACGGSSSGGATNTTARAGVAQGVGAPAPAATGESASGQAAKPAADSVVPSAAIPQGPRVQLSARVALQVANGRFDATLDAVTDVAEQAGGHISGQDAQAPSNGEPLRSGQVTFQVPADRFQGVVSDIRRKGTTQNISISGNDVSQQYVDLQARLRNAEAQRNAILALMQDARTVADTIQIQNQLGQVTGQIEQLHGQIDYLDHSIAFSTIAVTIREAAVTGVRDEWGLQTAATQAAHNLVNVLAFLLLAIGTLIPLLLLGAVAWVVGRAVWRRYGWRATRRPAPAPAAE